MKTCALNLTATALAVYAAIAAGAAQDCTLSYSSGTCQPLQCSIRIDGDDVNFCGNNLQGAFNAQGTRLTLQVPDSENPSETDSVVFSGNGDRSVSMEISSDGTNDNEVCDYTFDVSSGACLGEVAKPSTSASASDTSIAWSAVLCALCVIFATTLH